MEVLRTDEIDHRRARMDRRPTPWSRPQLPESLAYDLLMAKYGPPTHPRDISNTEAEAVEAAIDAYDQALAAPTDEEIAVMIGQLAVLYPNAKLSPQEIEMRLDLYIECLGDLPTDLLREACFAVAKKCRFFPLIAEIRAEVEEDFNRRRNERYTLQRLLRKHQGL